jgi:hypothetical protein
LSTKANPWLSAGVSVLAAEKKTLSLPGSIAGGGLASETSISSGISLTSQLFEKGVLDPGTLIVPRYPAEFRFETFFHPYTAEFQRRLNRFGVPGLLNISSQKTESLPKLTTFDQAYAPDLRTIKSTPRSPNTSPDRRRAAEEMSADWRSLRGMLRNQSEGTLGTLICAHLR